MNTAPLTIEQLCSDVSLETAFAQLREQWRNKGDNHLCWNLRYMDDWLFLCHTRWHLRKAVKQMNRILVELKVTKAENKTFIGRTVKGFDWLGYRIEPVDPMPVRPSGPGNRALAEHDAQREPSSQAMPQFRLVVNRTCLQNHFTKLSRLYEQGASKEALAAYVKRWRSWVNGGWFWKVGLTVC